jgi:hypothetical protein
VDAASRWQLIEDRFGVELTRLRGLGAENGGSWIFDAASD